MLALLNSYRCYSICAKDTRATRICETVKWFPDKLRMPIASDDLLRASLSDHQNLEVSQGRRIHELSIPHLTNNSSRSPIFSPTPGEQARAKLPPPRLEFLEPNPRRCKKVTFHSDVNSRTRTQLTPILWSRFCIISEGQHSMSAGPSHSRNCR
jgi:hypothetical protein